MKHLNFSFWIVLFLFASGSILTLIGLFFSASANHINPFLVIGPSLLVLNLLALIHSESKLRLKRTKSTEIRHDIPIFLLQLRPVQLGLIIAILAELIIGLLLTSIAPTMTYSYISSFLCCLICLQLIVYIATLILYRNKT